MQHYTNDFAVIHTPPNPCSYTIDYIQNTFTGGGVLLEIMFFLLNLSLIIMVHQLKNIYFSLPVYLLSNSELVWYDSCCCHFVSK